MVTEPKTIELLKDRLSGRDLKRLSKLQSPEVIQFITNYAQLCNPAKLHVSVGTEEDLRYAKDAALKGGEEALLAIKGHRVHFENYSDQGRDRENTKILVRKGEELGNGIRSCGREPCLSEMKELLRGIMAGREMFVAFYCLGPVNSEFSIPCVQITDSSYVVHSENILYRQGYEELVRQGKEARPFKFVHSEGQLDERRTSMSVEKRRVYVDLEGETVFSVNTQYGGNTIGLKKLGMRLAIRRASMEGWLNEHMLIMGIHGQAGRKTYFTGAFPSMCGKTATAMVEGETIVGDDITFLRRRDGAVWAVNTEKGVFGIIRGLNSMDDPMLWETIHKPGDVIFSNVLVTPGGGVFWEGKDGPIPKSGINHSGSWWPGKRDQSGNLVPPSHPNARFNVALDQFSNVDPGLECVDGVKVEGIMYGGRDSDTSVPVQESFGWAHGMVTLGASLESETTAATLGEEGVRELNPMSNLDFLSIPVGKYVRNNLEFGKGLRDPPHIFGINYFLKGPDGSYLNEKNDKRVWLKWMELRVHGDVGYAISPTGRIPLYGDLCNLFERLLSKKYQQESYITQFSTKVPKNLAKLDRAERYYSGMGSAPPELFRELERQRLRLQRSRSQYGESIDPNLLPRVRQIP